MYKSRFIDSKFFSFMDITYRLVRASLLFWLYAGRGFIIAGLISSTCTLAETIDEIFKGNGTPVRKLFKEISRKYANHKRLSAFMFFLFIYIGTFIILPFPKIIDSFAASVIKFVCIYAFLLAIIFFTYLAWNLVHLQLSIKKTLLVSLYLIAKKPFRSLILVVAILLIGLLIYVNFIFFLFFAPAIYGTCTRYIFTFSWKKKAEAAM